MGEYRRKTDFGAGKQQHRCMYSGRDHGVREGKGARSTEERGAGIAGPREAQAGPKDREGQGWGQTGLALEECGDRDQ